MRTNAVECGSRSVGPPICLVTGATSGIGAATAALLARQGAILVLVGRDRRRCERVGARLQGAVSVEFLVGDLAIQGEVERLAQAFRARHPRLDVLINNAGSYAPRFERTVDGIERTLAVNHLSHFLLTNLLLERLRSSSGARVVTVASAAHGAADVDFDAWNEEACFERTRAYARSKLANLLFTYELARRLAGTNVTANAIHPGVVATSLGRDRAWLRTIARNVLKGRAMRSAEAAASDVVYLATSQAVAGVTGRYFDGREVADSSPASRDVDAARALWGISERLTALPERR